MSLTERNYFCCRKWVRFESKFTSSKCRCGTYFISNFCSNLLISCLHLYFQLQSNVVSVFSFLVFHCLSIFGPSRLLMLLFHFNYCRSVKTTPHITVWLTERVSLYTGTWDSVWATQKIVHFCLYLPAEGLQTVFPERGCFEGERPCFCLVVMFLMEGVSLHWKPSARMGVDK